MELIGKIKDITRSIAGETIISLVIEDGTDAVPGLTKLYQAGNRLAIQIKKYRKKRSLDANNYFWQLADEIAKAMTDADAGVQYTKWDIYLMKLKEYGVFTTIGCRREMKPELEKVYRAVEEVDEVKISYAGKEKEQTIFHCYYGSSCYDSKQMADLINGTVVDANDLGIETATPSDIEEMLEAMRIHEKEQADKGM